MFGVRFRNASGPGVISERFRSERGSTVVMTIDIVPDALEDSTNDVLISTVFSRLTLNQICIVCVYIVSDGQNNSLNSQFKNP